MNKRQHEKEILENELVTWTEKKFGHLKPHLPMVGIVAGAAVIAVILGLWWWDLAEKNRAVPWRVLNRSVSQTRLVGDARSLELVAEDFPEEPAGLWALQLAADFEMRTGILQYSGDEQQRKEGMDKVRKAKKLYLQIVESGVEKSTMLQRRSLFGLAYAAESLGEFDEAAKYYSQLLEQAGDSPFKEAAQRGLERTSQPEFAKLFEQFVSYVPPESDEAPGPSLPQRPDISFPELPGGGDFQPGGQDNSDGSESATQGDEGAEGAEGAPAKSIPAQPIIPMEAFDPKYAPEADKPSEEPGEEGDNAKSDDDNGDEPAEADGDEDSSGGGNESGTEESDSGSGDSNDGDSDDSK